MTAGYPESAHPAFPQHARCGSQHLQLSTPSHLPIRTADVPSPSYRRVARGRRSVMMHGETCLSMHLDSVAVTTPFRALVPVYQPRIRLGPVTITRLAQ